MTDEADLSSAIAALWERQRGEMMRRVDIVEAGVAALRAGTLDASQRAETERAAHKIAGSAGGFGYADASRDARTIELTLREGNGDAGRLAELVAAIRRDFGRAPSLPGAPPAPPAGPSSESPGRAAW